MKECFEFSFIKCHHKCHTNNNIEYMAIVWVFWQDNRNFAFRKKKSKGKSICKHLRHSRSIFFVFQKLFTTQLPGGASDCQSHLQRNWFSNENLNNIVRWLLLLENSSDGSAIYCWGFRLAWNSKFDILDEMAEEFEVFLICQNFAKFPIPKSNEKETFSNL